MTPEMVVVAARSLDLMSWIALGMCACILMVAALAKRDDDYLMASLGLCALIFGRSVLWLLS